MSIRNVRDIVNESVNNQNHFPDLDVIINAINDGHQLDSQFANALVNRYVKEDDDLIKVIDLMIQNNYEFDKLIIFDLAKNGFFKTMEYFKNLNFDLNVKNDQNENALFYIIQRGVARFNHIDSWWRTEDYFEVILENCIRLGIDENNIDSMGRNLFHVLALEGGPDIYFDTLMRFNININQIDNNGWTPLHLACGYNSDNEFFKKFVQNGADILPLTKNRITYFEEEFDAEETPEICSAYDLRLHYLNSLGGEYILGTEAYNSYFAEIETYLKPNKNTGSHLRIC